MAAVLLQIINLLTDGLVAFGEGIGSGVSSMVTSLFLSGTGESMTLSTFGGLIVVFAAIALTIGLSRWIMNWVTSLGN